MPFRHNAIIPVLIAVALPTLAHAQGQPGAQPGAPSFAHIFGDHAVLQRDRPIAVWGSAAPKANVTVSLNGQSAQGVADGSGRWRVTLPKMAAGGAYTLTASTGGATTTLNDIAVGDVYLCSGQSNMEFPARLATGTWNGVTGSINPNLRFVTIEHDSTAAPREDLKAAVTWKQVGPDTAGDASAVCYYMARSLQQKLKIPVGFIDSDWGGTTIQSWIGADALRTLKPYEDGVAELALLATAPLKAKAEQNRREEAWWDAHDPNAKAQRAWIAPDFDDSAWGSLSASGSWKDAGIAELADFDGVMWFRTSVTLTAAQAASANALELGPVDTYDSAWINGSYVGSGTTAWMWRVYDVPANIFHAGRNVIALRVLGGGGPTGRPENRGIRTASGTLIPLSAPWHYRAGMRAKGLSIAPAPWTVPTSLSTLYNGMIAPIRDYGFTMVAWYQGESNADAGKEYETLLPLLMADWRHKFATPDLPFMIAQLASYGSVATKPGHSGWAELRQAQSLSVQRDKHAGLAVTIDVGDRTDIHPSQKTVVGERLARAARAVVYGEHITPGGPEAISVARSGVDLIVSFRNTDGGLRTYSSDNAIGFEACAGESCSYATAIAKGDTILLQGANKPGITRVRYAWADAPYVNLYSAEDLPAVPFEMAVGAGSAP
ncbi:MAG: sialate O-acetylesterase [Sphingomonas sp.]